MDLKHGLLWIYCIVQVQTYEVFPISDGLDFILFLNNTIYNDIKKAEQLPAQ